MTWEIFLGIVALLSFVIAIITPIVKLVKTIDAIDLTLARLKEVISSVMNDSKKMYDDIEDLFDKVNDHEKRISQIEIERRMERTMNKQVREPET